MKQFFINFLKIISVNKEADILEDASSSTLQNKKRIKPARSLNQAKTKGMYIYV